MNSMAERENALKRVGDVLDWGDERLFRKLDFFYQGVLGCCKKVNRDLVLRKLRNQVLVGMRGRGRTGEMNWGVSIKW